MNQLKNNIHTDFIYLEFPFRASVNKSKLFEGSVSAAPVFLRV